MEMSIWSNSKLCFVARATMVQTESRVAETTKLTQELAVKLEQGRDLRQWHLMAN